MPGPSEARTNGQRHPDGHYSCRRCAYSWMPRDPEKAPKKCPRCYAWLDKAPPPSPVATGGPA